MPGLVTQTLASRLRQQLDSRGLVVWLDHEQHYGDALDGLELGETELVRYDGSFFELRHRIEPHLRKGETPPRLLVYVPLAESQAYSALIEVISAGVLMRPGKQPPLHNTRLAVIARAALGQVMSGSRLEATLRDVEEGRLTLGELDQLAEQTSSAGVGVLGLLFESTNAATLALAFATEEKRDRELLARGALPALCAQLESTFGVALDPTRPIPELRHAFARYVLVTELLAAGARIDSLASMAQAPPGPFRLACLDLATTWRLRRDRQDSYVAISRAVEQELRLDDAEVDRATYQQCDTFASLDERAYHAAEADMLAGPTERVIAAAEARMKRFWSVASPEVMKRWALLAAIGRVRVGAADVIREVESAPPEAATLVRGYREGLGGAAWALLDAHQRHMEARYHQFDLDHSVQTLTEQLIARARDDHTRTVARMTDRFGEALLEKRTPSGLPRQLATYRRFVDPLVSESRRVAYILVDGLRYEMGAELARSFGEDVNVDLAATLGVLPSITQVGMVAVLPRSDEGAELVPIDRGRVAVQLGGKVLRNRSDRMAYFASYFGEGFEEVKLGDILPPRGRTKMALKQARFVCVTATDELDGICEKGDVALARRMMDDVILQLRRAVRLLFDLGFERIVLTADHGFLFGESLDAGSKIDPPGGETVDLHRRAWIGRGGAASPSVFRTKAADVGLGGDLEIVVPRGVGGFRSGGRSTAYFHGGASLQELVVPVLTIQPGRPSARPVGTIEWSLQLGSRAISSPFVSVTVSGRSTGLFAIAPPTVLAVVQDGRTPISRPVVASYGFDDSTGIVQLRMQDVAEPSPIEPNTITLLLDPLPTGASVEVVLLDGETEKQLASIEAPVKLTPY